MRQNFYWCLSPVYRLSHYGLAFLGSTRFLVIVCVYWRACVRSAQPPLRTTGHLPAPRRRRLRRRAGIRSVHRLFYIFMMLNVKVIECNDIAMILQTRRPAATARTRTRRRRTRTTMMKTMSTNTSASTNTKKTSSAPCVVLFTFHLTFDIINTLTVTVMY